MKRVWLGLFGFLSLGTVAACYSPDLSGVHYICDENNPYCPDGLTCIAGTCAKPGQLPGGDLGTGNPDGGPPPNPDGGMSGCRAGGGTPLGGNVWACPGKFSIVRGPEVPHADQLCLDGYGLCSQANGADLAKCKTLTGFFAAQTSVRGDKGSMDPSKLICGDPKNGNDSHFYTGCGRSAQGTVYDIPDPCAGFSQVIECHFGGVWGCLSYTPLSQADNTVATDGVLCCKM